MKFKIIIVGILSLILLNSCQTIKNKSDEVAERENEKFGQFVGKQASEIKSELGVPTDDYIDELGNETLVYKTKKYGIPCERKFTINTNGTIIGFPQVGVFNTCGDYSPQAINTYLISISFFFYVQAQFFRKLFLKDRLLILHHSLLHHLQL